MVYKPVDTAITMVVGPLIDDSDFKSLEEAIAYNAAGMDVSLIVEKTDGTTATTAITLTTGGTSDWTHKDGGYYEIEITAAQNIEEGVGYVRGICTGVLPFESAHYNIVKGNVYDSWVKGTDVLDVSITQLGGVAQSLTDLKDFADAGYDPATNKITGTMDMRGTDGVSLVIPDAAGVAPTAVEIRTEMDNNSTKMAPSQTLADYKATGFSTHNAAAIWSVGTRALTDKAGFALSAAGAKAIWDQLTSALTTVGSIGKLCVDNINATISSRNSTTPPTVTAIRTEMDSNSTKMAPSQVLADYKATGFNTTTPPTVEAIADQVWDEILTGATHNIATSAGKRLRDVASLAIRSETAAAGTAVTITLDAGASADDGVYNRNLVAIVGGTGVGQTRQIAGYDGTTKVVTVDREWRVNPNATSEYVVVASNVFALVDQGQAQAATATTITLRAYASAINDTYLCNQVVIIAGTGRGQSRLIGGYVGATKVATICGDNWVTTPDTTSTYVLLPYGTTCTSCLGTGALGQINTECDTALTDYDPPTRTEATSDKDAIVTEVNANETKIDALNNISVADIIAGVTDDTLDLQEMLRIILAATAGKSSGGGTVTLTFRDAADSKPRITATVDANGNRTAMVTDGS